MHTNENSEGMLDNFIVNIKTILPIAKPNNDRRNEISDKLENDECAIAFIKQNTKDSSDTKINRTTMNAVRSYFSRFYRKKSVTIDADNSFMLPRVFNQTNDKYCEWDPVELKAKEKFIEDIDNVIDKFSRVISVNETHSPKRNEYFYV